MINKPLAKARVHSDFPSLLEDLYDPNMHPSNKDAFNYYYNSKNLVETRIRYINESNFDISLIGPNGFTMDIPKANCFRNRLIIAVTWEWGMDCEINYGALYKHIPFATEELINKIHNSIKVKHYNNPSPKELSFFYKIDLNGIEDDRHGIFVEELNLQVVDTKYAAEITKYEKDFIRVETHEDEIDVGALSKIIYFTNDPNCKDPLFMLFGNELVLLEPTFIPNCKIGVKIALNGSARFMVDHTHSKQRFIEPKDYMLNGIYESASELINSLRKNKELSKDRIDKIISLLEKYAPKEETTNDSFKEFVIFGNLKIKHIIDFFAELGKIELVLSKIFK